MSSGIPIRRRDLFRGFLGRSAKQPLGRNVAQHPCLPAPSITTMQQTNNPSHDFLTDGLKELSAQNRDVVQEHVSANISDTVQAAYDAARNQKTICEDKRWPASEKADKVLLWLDRFKSVGDIIANADPIHVGLPWAGIRMLLEVCFRDRDGCVL